MPDRRSARGREATLELVLGALLVGAVAIGGLWFALRPASGRLDGRLLDLVTGSQSRWFIDMANSHHPWVIVTGAVIAAVVAFPQDRFRSLACLVGPPLALLVAELVVKPAVGRTLGGSLSYPSGSVVGAAAVATAVVLATPVRWRAVTAALGAVYAVWMTVSVIALRWHYPTDALAGLAWGVGVVLLVDAASWLAFHRRSGGQGRRLRAVSPGSTRPSPPTSAPPPPSSSPSPPSSWWRTFFSSR